MDGFRPVVEQFDAHGDAFEASPAQPTAQNSLDARLGMLRGIRVRRRVLTVSLVFSDALACLLAIALSQLAYDRVIDLGVAALVLMSGFPIYFLAALQTGAHNPAIARRPSDSIRSAALAFFVTTAIFFFGLFAAKLGTSVSRLEVGQTLLFTFLFGAAGRYAIAVRSMQLVGVQPFADLCIYDDVPFSPKHGKGAIRAAEVGLQVDLSSPEMVARLGELARGMDRIVVHCSPERRIAWSQALRCVDRRSEIVMPELTELMPLDVRYRGDSVSLVLANGPLRWNQRLTKLLFDYTFATLALLVAVPLMVLIALAVKLESPGPVFFKQERIGLGNRRFKIWKFRTMRADLADHTGTVSTMRQDDRVTRLGGFLRRTSLDELPQFFNVLAGQMSIVGPRPHAVGSRADEMLFWDIDQRYWYRHSVRPGITGLAQIRGLRGATTKRDDLEQRLYADLEYAANWSLMTDVRIVFQTFAVLLHRNAY